ncbi:MAG TPA: fatty acid--CoA ligase family protein [Acidisoma sp.]|uniref:ANL family adenylate-forming protein n=1 Tax=Acidisoma sp. TaxID=1872115 RepID=UPI002CF8CEFC|nr:fatty acid--CoA ligase family protein [Acidisoma sp.]HTI00455.1 fatty acid--CoA ligase family protein [Acidisoma sp.]
MSELASKKSLEAGPLMRDRCVLLATVSQLATVLALVALDGLVRRIVICTPDLSQEHIELAIKDAGIDLIVTEGGRFRPDVGGGLPVMPCGEHLRHNQTDSGEPIATEWVLFTSGSTGRPKMVVHSLATLTGAVGDGVGSGDVPPVWSTFYDIRRYGGMQVLLRALACGGSMVLSDSSESPAHFLQRVGRAGVTHISGTPSQWRRALMSGAAGSMAPRYIRLSGEAADQAILDNLARHFPHAQVAHAFASTEAGVAFDVRDGKAGFPITLLSAEGPVQLRVEDGSLQIRSARIATRYLGAETTMLAGPNGFVDTGDIVEQHGDRYLFVGRRNDIINVGGLKVHPGAVESVINRHPAVSMSRVSSRRSPITGSIVVADVVLRGEDSSSAAVQTTLMEFCRQSLPPHEVPVSLRIVSSLALSASGKLARHYA